MKCLRLSMVIVCLSAGVAGALVQPAAAVPPGRSSYIVVLRDEVSEPAGVANEHARQHGAEIGFVYGSALKGYSAVIPNDRVAAVRTDDRVKYIEADQTAVASLQTTP